MFLSTHSKPVDPRFKPCPTDRQIKKDHGWSSLISQFSKDVKPGHQQCPRTILILKDCSIGLVKSKK